MQFAEILETDTVDFARSSNGAQRGGHSDTGIILGGQNLERSCTNSPKLRSFAKICQEKGGFSKLSRVTILISVCHMYLLLYYTLRATLNIIS
jgi:hypothetical protein